MCVNNELRTFQQAREPWPPHYSAPRSSLKSDIVSLRSHSQSSAGLSIVWGGEQKASWSRYTGAGDQLRIYHQRTSCGAGSRSRQDLNASFQTWVRHRSHLFGLDVYFISCDCTLMYERAPEVIRLFFLFRFVFVSLEVGYSPADAPLIVGFVSCLRWQGYFQRSLVTFTLVRNLSRILKNRTLLQLCIF